ncbi:MAG: tetratricopeptide repeat protein [Myxococcota bacterium]
MLERSESRVWNWKLGVGVAFLTLAMSAWALMGTEAESETELESVQTIRELPTEEPARRAFESEPGAAEDAPLADARLNEAALEDGQDGDRARASEDDLTVVETPEPTVVLVPEEMARDYLFAAEQAIMAGHLDEALTALRMHLHGHEESASLMLRIGRLARELRQWDLSERALDRAIELDPLGADLHLELGLLHLARERFDMAQTSAEEAVELAPEDPAAWNLLGRVALNQSRWEPAEFAFRRAAELEPTNGFYLNNLGLLYVMRRMGPEAESALRASVEMFEGHPPRYVHNNLGLALELQDELEQALQAFADALAVDPSYIRAQVNLRRVRDAFASQSLARIDDPPAAEALME